MPLVLLSVLVAMVGSFTALTHAQRMRESEGRRSWMWLLTGGLTLGAAIWTMHFIGMLAFRLPTPTAYDIPLTLLSVVPAIAAALLGFYLLRTHELRMVRIAGGSALMGLGISAMHYTGMAALKMSPPINYSLPIVALSVLIAILAALGALLIVYASEKKGWNYWLRYSAGGAIMGLAISAMHYTGMAAAEFPAGSICLSGASRIEPELLALFVSLGALFLFICGMLATLFDRHMAWQKNQALAQLQAVHAELERRAQRMAETVARKLRASHNMFNLILDSVPQAVFWKDRNSVYVGCNKAFARDAGLTHPDEVIGKTDFDLPWTREESEIFRADDQQVMNSNAAKLHIIVRQRNAAGEYRWIEINKMPLTDGEVFGVLGIYEDITARRAAEQQARRLTNIYAALSQCNQAIVGCTSEEELFPLICLDAVQFGGMKMAWIGLVDQASQLVKPVAAFGAGIEYLEGIRISVDAGDPSGRGPTGTSIRENQPFWCQDFQRDPATALWHERGARAGWGASASLPLHRKGKAIGAFTLYADEVNAFDEHVRVLLMEMAMDIDIALDRYILQTEHKQAEAELRIAAVTFETQEAILITDSEAKILRVNQAFQDITGYSAAEVIGCSPRMFQSGRHDAAFYQAMWTALSDTGGWAGEIWDRRKSGEIYPKFMTISAVYDDRQEVTHYVAVSRDISLSKKSERDIHQLAFFDSLTSLPNRRLLLDRLRQAMAAGARNDRHGALLFLDLDHFKNINDTQGHMLGDLLLAQVAHRLLTCVREGDSVARLGGDEFVVLLNDLSRDVNEAASQTESVAEKIRNELDRPYVLNDYECLTTPSIGICLFYGHQESMDSLLQHADIAMYQAKAAGRNTIRFFDPDMQAALDMRSDMEADLRQALKKQQFHLHYQIQVDELNRPLGAETLIRWIHPERGLVTPAQFIPLAEETGLIVPIGLWVLRTACAQLKEWQNDALTRGLTLAVNVSAKQFRQADFVAEMQRVLLESGAQPSNLKLELTESTVLENVADTISKMHEIKAFGVSFSMDDFGTGYSSLQYLKRLPLDQIKIDQSFVRDIATDQNDAAIVQTIIAMAETLGLNVIAEGVETEAQREFLELRGCHAFQGHLFGKPVPIEQFEVLLLQKQRKS